MPTLGREQERIPAREVWLPGRRTCRPRLYEPVGCQHCVGGYKGRHAIHETLYVTEEIRDVILSSGERIDSAAITRAAIRNGMRTLRRTGLDLAKKGVSSVEEVVSATTID